MFKKLKFNFYRAGVCWFVAALTVGGSFGAERSSTATVTGEGGTYWEARQDCIRQAVQQTVPQLVIADRRIEADKVVKDTVLSTMNGFVDSFHVVQQWSEDRKIRMKAEVRISLSGIENFVLSQGKGGAKFDSDTLLSNLTKDDLARDSRTAIIKRLFDGFPARAFDASIQAISPDPQNRAKVLVTIDVQTNRMFVKNLKSALRIISRPGEGDYKTPELAKFCLDANVVDTDNGNRECRTAEVNFSGLGQRRYEAGGYVYFLVWFSGSSASPLLLESEYLRLNRYQPSSPITLNGVGNVLFGSTLINGAGHLEAMIHLTEATRRYDIRIPKEKIPEGSKEVHALPIFVDHNSQSRVLLSLFAPPVAVDSDEFRSFVADIINEPR